MTEIDQRRRTLSARLPELKIDALLVSSPANVRYLTGYAGSNGILLLTKSDSHFFTDPRYALEVAQQITCKVHVEKKPLLVAAAAIIKRKRLKKIGFESSWLRYDDYIRVKEDLPLGSALHPIGRIIEEQRMVKSAAEMSLIRRSVATNSEAYSKTIRRVHAGAREMDIAAELDYQMRALGAEKAAFDTIVAAGPRTALPHAHPTPHRLGENELLLIDMGASQEGYASDMTRVAHTGTPPKRILRLYKAVLEAQLAALSSIKAGITTGEVDAAARNVLKRHELDRAFVHSTGHGLGLEIHEPPRIARKDKTKLQAGMAITIEPGAYIDGLGGIRIEDTVLVTEHGCEVLTPTPKDLIEL
ncbi:MAG TPA: Xaa-Pro peptidase family protein [Bryobacteraceae bacterium]|nr:Xaa-Pro peptidase family protein [Bryobacteraceae bacterium]